MFRKILLGLFALVVLILGIMYWLFLTSSTKFSGSSKFLYIRTGHANYESLIKTLTDSGYINSVGRFNFIAQKMGLPENIHPGRYEIKKGMSLLDISRMLKNGRQTPITLVITKIRTKENFGSMIARKFESDSASVLAFMNNNDSLKAYGLDSSTVMTGVLPNSYQFFWNSSPSTIFKSLFAEKEKFWNKEKLEKIESKKLTPITAYILASIVEEESIKKSDKDTIASVYLNRYHKGMRLQADPTVKFALREFGLKRIYEKHLSVESPYNTYRVTGLPPGPICTPSEASLDAVINAPVTNYYYFVANSDFSGTHLFSETYDQHLKFARDFQVAQDQQQKIRAEKENTGH